MSGCVFCAIARGEMGVPLIYEDEHVVAFNDIAPQAPVHALIVPRGHFEHVGDGVPREVLAALLAAVEHVARAKGVDETGYRLIVNKGADARQSVPHLHLHVLGGTAMSHGMVVLRESE